MLTIEKLEQYGANTAEGLTRCAGMEAFYIKLVNMSLNEGNFDKLETAIKNNDLDTAFEAAHALKGVLGNLSLTPMFDICSEMTELLRDRTEMDYTPMLNELLTKKAELVALSE